MLPLRKARTVQTMLFICDTQWKLVGLECLIHADHKRKTLRATYPLSKPQMNANTGTSSEENIRVFLIYNTGRIHKFGVEDGRDQRHGRSKLSKQGPYERSRERNDLVSGPIQTQQP